MRTVFSFPAADDDFEYIATAFDIYPSNNVLHMIGLPVYIQLPEDGRWADRFEQILTQWLERSPMYVLRTRIRLEQLYLDLCLLRAGAPDSYVQQSGVLPAIDYIHRFYDQSMSAAELSVLCKLSVSHFRRVFKETTGVSPMQYRENIRIHWAGQLLVSGVLSISEIAEKLGYYDVYHFSKDFKRNTNQTPRQYIRAYARKEPEKQD